MSKSQLPIILVFAMMISVIGGLGAGAYFLFTPSSPGGAGGAGAGAGGAGAGGAGAGGAGAGGAGAGGAGAGGAGAGGAGAGAGGAGGAGGTGGTGGAGAGCAGAEAPSGYTVTGSGGCHNDYVFAANNCRQVSGSDTVGQQSNGCWQCLKSGGGNTTEASYPMFFDSISNIKSGYAYVGEGGCTEAIEIPLGKCIDNSLCLAAGQQDNGCWHLLSEGDIPVSNYKRYIR